MAVKSIAIRNYRAFVDVPPVELGPINVLVGPNNGGKSSLISALYLMQIGSDSNTRDVRVASGNPQAEIDIGLVDVPEIRAWNADEDVTLSMKLRPGAFEIKLGPNRSVQQLPEAEPDHFIVPYLSRRKVASYARRYLGARRWLSSQRSTASLRGSPGSAIQRFLVMIAIRLRARTSSGSS
jgi:hypothetical protein